MVVVTFCKILAFDNMRCKLGECVFCHRIDTDNLCPGSVRFLGVAGAREIIRLDSTAGLVALGQKRNVRKCLYKCDYTRRVFNILFRRDAERITSPVYCVR